MSIGRASRCTVLLLLLSRACALGAQLVPVGAEFQVSTYTTGDQQSPAVAMDDAGDFVVVWESLQGQDGSTYGVFGQRYDRFGVPAGTEFLVNTYTFARQEHPSIAMDAAGNFLVAWSSQVQGVVRQRFDTTGAPLGGEVVDPVRNDFFYVSAAMNGAGQFVIASATHGDLFLTARQYDPQGIPLGPSFVVNTYNDFDMYKAGIDVSIDAASNFVVAWGGCGEDCLPVFYYGRSLDRSGAPLNPVTRYGSGFLPHVSTQGPLDFTFAMSTVLGTPLTYESLARRYRSGYWQDTVANDVAAGAQVSAGVTGDHDGNLVVAFRDLTASGTDLFGQLIDVQGAKSGPNVHLNAYTTQEQTTTDLAMNDAGQVVAVWQSQGQDGSGWGVYGQRYCLLGGPPRGTERLVNAYTASDQFGPKVAGDPDGDGFVVVWQSAGEDGSADGVFGQRLDADGSRVGAEFRVNTFTAGAQGEPAVAADGSGAFVVVWSSDGQDGSGKGVFGQRFDGAGQPQGNEIAVNAYTTLAQDAPAVAVLDSGETLIAWRSHAQDGSGDGIYAQRFSSSGLPQGPEFRVNGSNTGDQRRPAVGRNGSDGWVVVWQSFGQDGSDEGVYGVRYDAAGVRLGSDFAVNSYTPGPQSHPVVAGADDGGFVVVWQSLGQDGSGWGILGRRFDADGSPIGSEFQVNAWTTGDQTVPSATAGTDGAFDVVWQSADQDSHQAGVFTRHFDSAGMPGPESAVNTTTCGDQGTPAIAASGSGGLAVAWVSPQDGSDRGVLVQAFGSASCPLLAVSSPADQTTCPGGTASFSVRATGAGPFTYQWRRNGVPLVEGGSISGSSTRWLVVTSDSGNVGAAFDCVVTDGCAEARSATSTIATLSWYGDPPPVETLLVRRSSSSQLTLSWQHVGSDLYTIRHAPAPNGGFSTVSSVTTRTATIALPTDNRFYVVSGNRNAFCTP